MRLQPAKWQDLTIVAASILPVVVSAAAALVARPLQSLAAREKCHEAAVTRTNPSSLIINPNKHPHQTTTWELQCHTLLLLLRTASLHGVASTIATSQPRLSLGRKWASPNINSSSSSIISTHQRRLGLTQLQQTHLQVHLLLPPHIWVTIIPT